MSFADRAVLWLHLVAAIFTIGPGTAAIMSTPRYIRRQNTVLVGYLYRTTRIYSIAALLTLVFGAVLAGMTHKFSQWWISVSLTLFVVAFVLLVLIMRDQRTAVTALTTADDTVAAGRSDTVRSSEVAPSSGGPAAPEAAQAPQAASEGPGTEAASGDQPATTVASDAQPAAATDPRTGLRLAAVERGRIASMGGITALIWLVILVLMVWH
jgi:Ca2+/Na+ antiporter